MKEFWEWYSGLIERIPLPERSGVKGILVAFAFFWFFLSPISIDGGLLDTLVCEVMPWRCVGATAPAEKPVQKLRDLGKLTPVHLDTPPEIRVRLKRISADHDSEATQTIQREAIQEIAPRSAARQRKPSKHSFSFSSGVTGTTQWNAVASGSQLMICNSGNGMCSGPMTIGSGSGTAITATWTTSTAGTTMIVQGQPVTVYGQTFQPIGTRKGPFCRVTCTFACHAGLGTYDAETDVEYCKQQHIPDDAVTVLGWVDTGNGYEYQNGWPGPAVEPGALKYKLYWKP